MGIFEYFSPSGLPLSQPTPVSPHAFQCNVSLHFYFSILTEMGSIAGEVSLPGGKREEGDADDVQTALREAKEEIGLDPSLVSVITLLPPFHTKVFVSLFNFILVLTSFAFI